MSYFCILSNSKAFPDQDHSCLKMGQCNSCRDYQRGMFAPRYGVPAIRQSFEYIQNVRTGEIALMHCVQGAYDGN